MKNHTPIYSWKQPVLSSELVKIFSQGNNVSLWWAGQFSTDESDVLTVTAPQCHLYALVYSILDYMYITNVVVLVTFIP